MKRVLVTGGTGTLGAPLVRALCASEFVVTANFFSDTQRAENLASETGCSLVRADCAAEKEVNILFQSAEFDSIVHCAGRNSDALLLRTSPTLWNEILHSHLTSAFLISRASLEFLPRGANLLLVASRVGERGNSGQSAYAAAKAGVLGLMKSAAREGCEKGIRVNAICPGYAPNEENLSLAQQIRRESEDEIPFADAGESFADFVTWFLRSNSRISGQILRPDCRI